MPRDRSETQIELYRCKECGKISTSVGWLHGHAEKHRGFFGLQLPWKFGDFDELQELTETITVTDYEVTDGVR